MTAHHELDRMCREVRSELVREIKATSNSMGRIGLSCARRHPALLLGGGALLGFGATLFLTRGRKHVHSRSEPAHAQAGGVDERREASNDQAPRTAAKPSKAASFATGAAMRILKSAARMWLLEHLSSHLGEKEEPD